MKPCACGCGRLPPAGEKRRWATPECFVKGGRRRPTGIAPVMLSAEGDGRWTR